MIVQKGRRNNLISLSMTEFGPDMSFPPLIPDCSKSEEEAI